MIKVKTKLYVKDNSGAELVRCIKVLGTSNKKSAKLGNLIICSILKKNFKKFKLKKKIFLSFLCEIKKNNKRRGNIYICGQKNSVILLNEEKKFIHTRTYGRMPIEFLRYKISNFWSYVNGVY